MLLHAHRIFVPGESHLTVQKESDKGYKLYADIIFMTEQFREFQFTVIEETLAQISDLISSDELLFDDIIRTFESILQDANEKLILFADKMTSVPSFDIRGIITLSQHTSFVSAVIGDVSIVLVRKGHVGYSMQNDTDARQRISLFSDIIEGDITRDDEIYFFGMHIATLMDRDDMESVIQKVPYKQPGELLEKWIEDISTRVSLQDMGIIVQYSLDTEKVRKKGSSGGLPMPQWVIAIKDSMKHIFGTTFDRLQQKLQHRQFLILLISVGVFLLFVLGSIVHGRIKNYTTATINSDGTTTASLSIEDIKKEIFEFQKLDPTSDEKSTKYNALTKELKRIEDEGKWANDVMQLKKILDTEYLQGFNIIVLDSLADQTVYQFSSLETSTLGRPLQVFFNKGIYIAGTQGAILGGISTDIKGTAVRNASADPFTSCSVNLLKNGLYCVTSKNSIYHIAKAGSEPIGGENISFPGSIISLSTFGSANFYVLTNDPTYTKDASYIIRYTNVLGSQNTFGSTIVLPLLHTEGEEAFSQGFSSLAIDGSFLVWSKQKKTVYQLYRSPQDKALTSREIPLKGGVNLGKGFSEDVKVMTSPGTRYVYLYDRQSATLTAYLSSPAKNSDSYATSYSLDYVMRLDFSTLSELPADVIVDESDGKQIAYVLTSAGVAKIPMSDLLDTLKKTKHK